MLNCLYVCHSESNKVVICYYLLSLRVSSLPYSVKCLLHSPYLADFVRIMQSVVCSVSLLPIDVYTSNVLTRIVVILNVLVIHSA